MKNSILRNDETGKTRRFKTIHESRKALAVGDEHNPIWIPLSQMKAQNMMHLTDTERELIKENGETVHSCNLYTVKDWIWREKNL